MFLRDLSLADSPADLAVAATATARQTPPTSNPPPTYTSAQKPAGYDGAYLSPSQNHIHPDLRSPKSPSGPTARSVQLPESMYNELLPTPTDRPFHTRLPLNTEPTCPLDRILLDFQAERLRMTASGTPSASLVGPAYPSISSLLNPSRASAAHPLSKLLTDIISKFPSISGMPERVAVLHIMFLIMRWHISPTQENFDRLPPWAVPVKSQLEVPHPAWVDHLPW